MRIIIDRSSIDQSKADEDKIVSAKKYPFDEKTGFGAIEEVYDMLESLGLTPWPDGIFWGRHKVGRIEIHRES